MGVMVISVVLLIMAFALAISMIVVRRRKAIICVLVMWAVFAGILAAMFVLPLVHDIMDRALARNAQAIGQNYEISQAILNQLELSGTGDEITDIFSLNPGLLRVEYGHTGNRNFIVYLLDNEGSVVGLLANEIGETRGSSACRVNSSGSYLLEIKADGGWAIILY